MAGLYSAYLIKRKNPDAKILILEKENYSGGRAIMANFDGINVVCGAGIGRRNKDILLQELIDELDKNISHEFMVKHTYKKGIIHKFDYWHNYLQKAFHQKNKWSIMSFKNFAIQALGINEYPNFVKANGYSDFEKADFNDIMNNYGLEDNYKEYIGFGVNWKLLIDKMIEIIDKNNIKYKKNVISVLTNNEGNIEIKCKNKSYSAKNVIIATTIDTLKNLFPKIDVYTQIKGQPFIRLYAKFNKSSTEIINGLIDHTYVVGEPLQEIIPINKEKGIYMIGYADNSSANILEKHFNNENKFEYFEKLVATALNISSEQVKIIKLQSHYWKNGTHYNIPLKNYNSREEFIMKAQNPIENVYIVGEVVAKHQGWTEGALESVQEIINKL